MTFLLLWLLLQFLIGKVVSVFFHPKLIPKNSLPLFSFILLIRLKNRKKLRRSPYTRGMHTTQKLLTTRVHLCVHSSTTSRDGAPNTIPLYATITKLPIHHPTPSFPFRTTTGWLAGCLRALHAKYSTTPHHRTSNSK